MSPADEAQDPAPAAVLRAARRADLGDINAIYNHYVLDSTATYQNEPDSLEDRERWFHAHGPQHPVLVVEVAGEVVAWGALSRFHTRGAFAHTVEDSIYVHPDFHRQGIGRQVLSELIRLAEAAGHHCIIAAISGDQEPSLHLHARLGFSEAGRLREAGWKFNRWLDVVYLQRPVQAVKR
jgi:phosphinothricin acetyltransferase